MKRNRRALLGFAALAAFGAAAASRAANESPTRAPTAAQARAVRQVVQAQLSALANGNAQRAFSYAAPAIRERFGDANGFMAMVAGAYPMVIRPAATVFFQPTHDDAGILQIVQLKDSEGRLWRAHYQLQRQRDGQWRIAGCTVQPDNPATST